MSIGFRVFAGTFGAGGVNVRRIGAGIEEPRRFCQLNMERSGGKCQSGGDRPRYLPWKIFAGVSQAGSCRNPDCYRSNDPDTRLAGKQSASGMCPFVQRLDMK